MEEQNTMDKGTMAVYLFLVVAVIVLITLEFLDKAFADAFISIPILIILVLTIINDQKIVHIPPMLVILIVTMLYVSLLSKHFGGGALLDIIQNTLFGVMIGLAGLIVVYMLLREFPGFEKERPALVSLIAFTFGIAIYALWRMLEFFVMNGLYDDYVMSIGEYMGSMLWVAFGAILISVFFFAGRSSRFFNETVIKFLVRNSDTIGMQQPQSEVEQIIKMIEKGESDTLEFKSTLRTNLVTGEKDKRMEKAVLKTLVAFLNTDGGTLLIGVSDEGKITGIDLESFESRDKMNLHMTNLISSQIGNEFLPFIDFRVVDFENVCVMRVDCEPTYRPVFLYENKLELYYVRSGPSSVELIGMDLINYVNIRKENGEQEHGGRKNKRFKLKR